MDLKDIKAIIDLMKKNSLSEFELEKQDFKIKLKRSAGGSTTIYEDQPVNYNPATSLQQTNPLNATATASSAPTVPAGPAPMEIKSPMIGTIYRAPSPESGNYVEIGTEVNPETVVCIIEAMKVMNEIKAEARGIVTEILVDNAKPVEFGQPLFRIKSL